MMERCGIQTGWLYVIVILSRVYSSRRDSKYEVALTFAPDRIPTRMIPVLQGGGR